MLRLELAGIVDVGREWQLVVEVAHHAAVAVHFDLTVAKAVRQRPAQQWHEELSVACLPVDVEPLRMLGVAAVCQHVPQRAVESFRRRDGHVVGDDIDDEAEPVVAADPDELLPRRSAAEVVGQPRMVDDVIAVR